MFIGFAKRGIAGERMRGRERAPKWNRRNSWHADDDVNDTHNRNAITSVVYTHTHTYTLISPTLTEATVLPKIAKKQRQRSSSNSERAGAGRQAEQESRERAEQAGRKSKRQRRQAEQERRSSDAADWERTSSVFGESSSPKWMGHINLTRPNLPSSAHTYANTHAYTHTHTDADTRIDTQTQTAEQAKVYQSIETGAWLEGAHTHTQREGVWDTL